MKSEHRGMLNKAHEKVKKEIYNQDIESDITLEEGVDHSTREKILKLQKAKHEVMLWLKEQLRSIDKQEAIKSFESKSRKFHVRYLEGKLLARAEAEGEEIEITRGELLTDMIWGVGYELDPSSVPREIAKEYVHALTKQYLQALLDKQLVLYELSINTDEKERKSFSAIRERQEGGAEKLRQDQGFIAESMVFNLLKKCIIDHKVPISIEEADAFDDVVNKIDFVISRNDRRQGIDIQAKKNGEEPVGIQFTLMYRKDAMDGKRKTVLDALRRGISRELPVKNIEIVNIHPSYINRAVNKWKIKRLPGGPDSKLAIAAQVDILQKILTPLFSEVEIDQIINRIFNVDRHQLKYLKTY